MQDIEVWSIKIFQYVNVLVVLLSFFLSRKPRLAPKKQTSYETRAETTEQNFRPSAEDLRLVACNSETSKWMQRIQTLP